jgi:alpha-glucosidase
MLHELIDSLIHVNHNLALFVPLHHSPLTNYILKVLAIIISFLLYAQVTSAQRSCSQILEAPGRTYQIAFDYCRTGGFTISTNYGAEISITPTLRYRDAKGLVKTLKFNTPDRIQLRTVNEQIDAPFYRKATVANHYHEGVLRLNKLWEFHLRLYPDGVAYRWRYTGKAAIKIIDEPFELDISKVNAVIAANSSAGNKVDPFVQSFENVYKQFTPNAPDTVNTFFPPMLFKAGKGNIIISEADQSAYPGSHFRFTQHQGSTKATAIQPMYVLKDHKVGKYTMPPSERADYIAQVAAGARFFPWRIIGLFESDAAILESDLSFLCSPTPLANIDFSWITPGKAIWDWWNDWSLRGVDFKAGSNTATYLHYIDFAAEAGLQYFNIDDGWSDWDDALKVNPEVDLPKVFAHAKAKNVNIILWLTWKSCRNNTERVFAHYAAMGAKGFKVDFFDRDDQGILEWMEQALQIAARHKLLLNFHGAPKPAAWARKYPNEMNREGVYGAETFKWNTMITPEYECTVPFIRGFAGYTDYTPGGFRHVPHDKFKPVWGMPMVIGTRARQLAFYGIFDALVHYVSDLTSTYRTEKESLQWLSQIPVRWKSYKVLKAEIGKQLVVAREDLNGKWWFFGIGAADAASIDLDLSIWQGKKLHLFHDGINADRNPADYATQSTTIEGATFTIKLAPTGGFVGRLD